MATVVRIILAAPWERTVGLRSPPLRGLAGRADWGWENQFETLCRMFLQGNGTGRSACSSAWRFVAGWHVDSAGSSRPGRWVACFSDFRRAGLGNAAER
jgi:hypothetical protein